MEIKKLEELSYRVCTELEEVSKKREFSGSDYKTLADLTTTLKNIEKLKMYEDGGYSRDGSWRADMEGEYGHGASYRRDSRGRYARDGYARDGYSSTGYSRSSMVDHLEEMMGEASTNREREALRKCMETMKHM